MNPDHFVKVFDVLDSGYRDWINLAIGLILVAIGMALVVHRRTSKADEIPSLDSVPVARRRLRVPYLLTFAISWTVVAYSDTYPPYLRHRALAEANACNITEGPVRNFVPLPSNRHGFESFTVQGIPFRYSYYGFTDSFNDTSTHGGPIGPNSYVRICYDTSGNAILRLEIRNFKGQLKDYSTWPKDLSGISNFMKFDDLRSRVQLLGLLLTVLATLRRPAAMLKRPLRKSVRHGKTWQ
jgi:hypothetical protein